VSQAIDVGDVVFVAVPYGALPQLGQDYRAALNSKIVLDACNAVASRDGAAIADEVERNGIGITSQTCRALFCPRYPSIATFSMVLRSVRQIDLAYRSDVIFSRTESGGGALCQEETAEGKIRKSSPNLPVTITAKSQRDEANLVQKESPCRREERVRVKAHGRWPILEEDTNNEDQQCHEPRRAAD
jgi:hypothetical protein